MNDLTYDESAALLWLRESTDAAPGQPMALVVGALDKLTRFWLSQRAPGAEVEAEAFGQEQPPTELDDAEEAE